MHKDFVENVMGVVNFVSVDEVMKNIFLERLKAGEFTRDENPKSHFCVYFAGFDLKKKQVFIGHHRKSNLWLFNGGHVDIGELLDDAVLREMKEEWGIYFDSNKIGKPSLLTITEINNQKKQPCRLHYDIWYFISLDKNKFFPDTNLLNKEFFEASWKSFEDARKLVTNKNTLIALDSIEKL